MRVGDWALCLNGIGNPVRDGSPSRSRRHFKVSSVALVKDISDAGAIVELLGDGSQWAVKSEDIRPIDVMQTGDRHQFKICKHCGCCLPVDAFEPNQKKGRLRRPSCMECRTTHINKRKPDARQKAAAQALRPADGSLFECPICRRRTIVGVNARIVADHDHRTGDIREFICDSCNTGLGRFKNGKDCLRDAIRYIEERENFRG